MASPQQTQRKRFSTGAPWEKKVGYSRAVRVGNQIFVSGTVAANEAGGVVGAGDPYAQARQCLQTIREVLAQAGADLSHVVRTRLFVTRISDWPEIGRAHAEAFGAFPPATSMVEVARLIHPDFLVEIEADAVL